MKDFQTYKKELLQNPKVKLEYDKLAPRYALISQLIAARIKKGITQKELAKKMKTTQSSIARLEGGDVNPSLDFMQKLAVALNTSLQIQFKS